MTSTPENTPTEEPVFHVGDLDDLSIQQKLRDLLITSGSVKLQLYGLSLGKPRYLVVRSEEELETMIRTSSLSLD